MRMRTRARRSAAAAEGNLLKSRVLRSCDAFPRFQGKSPGEVGKYRNIRRSSEQKPGHLSCTIMIDTFFMAAHVYHGWVRQVSFECKKSLLGKNTQPLRHAALPPAPSIPPSSSSSAASFLRSQINCFLPPLCPCRCLCLCFPGIEVQGRTKPRRLGCLRFLLSRQFLEEERSPYLPQLRPFLYVRVSARRRLRTTGQITLIFGDFLRRRRRPSAPRRTRWGGWIEP